MLPSDERTDCCFQKKLDKQASPEKRSCKSGLHAEEKRKGAGLWCELGETGTCGNRQPGCRPTSQADQKGPDTHQLSFTGVKACLALCAYSGRGSPPPTHPAGVERGMWSSDCHSSVSSASAQPHMHIGRVENKPPLLASPQI
ncbi:Diglucosylglycerate octanoyltransferase [Dissostichus eleginoides]|uniref:Diglucosylglycerate octanoyltransferase n=1 Tax=Dissostichus eleginoides TaxID=100907 RepID=A0AAD9ET18_DISEL|nr:Diglucosylglycerate octanoyltransferase [Dissostichus eleginoides]